ncbi:hypothetical protein PRZ48_013653 [Zasmidium cellare]|uniref:Peptidase S53 domain-containing protein n=1 Tax=Zasmidium cellare TaxID=395010 RepID=A0ABR0E1L3_ZASCE|nr:hypothetical protein PRZ48_013653 [Zasmidium cellare]
MLTSFLLALVASTTAVPTKPASIVHEKRELYHASQHRRLQPVSKDAVLPVRIGLAQSNLDRGYDHLMEISHPSSEKYGQHWTAEEVVAEFAPAPEAVNSVLEWLASSGIEQAKQTVNKGWIAFDASSQQIERLFETQLHEYESRQDGSIRVGCDEYSLPQHIAPHVDYITPGVKLSPPMQKSVLKRDRGGWGSGGWGPGHWGPGGWNGRGGYPHHHWGGHPPSRPPYTGPWNPPPGAGQLPEDLRTCGLNITPACIRALYDVPFPRETVKSGVIGIYEENSLSSYSQEDLNLYFQQFAPYVPQGTEPTVISVNGGVAPVPQDSRQNSGEADIDLDMVYGLLGPVDITYYEVATPQNAPTDSVGSSFDPFLFAVDGSYCTENASAAGFQCGGAPLASIVSFSYGESEIGDGQAAVERTCNEFMKLSLQGHTFLFSSGDAGVAQIPAACDSNGCISRDLTTANGPIFNPSMGAVCPYVLSIGGTQLPGDKTVRDPEEVMSIPQIPEGPRNCTTPSAFLSSSGGFSNFFKTPKYQQNAVSSWRSKYDPGYPTYDYDGSMSSIGANGGVYNRNGRGVPDVSANGANFTTFNMGAETNFFGTSLSSPLWAALLALINQKRADIGKGNVGFVNAVLYEHPEVFNDITLGHNAGCGTDGFAAVPGWDPVTGLGTPNFPALEKLFLSLP